MTLPTCYCDNFRNGLTTDDVGLHACSKIQDGQVDCIRPQRPWIVLLDSGCSSDRHRCVAAHNTKQFPTCRCDSHAPGAKETRGYGLCMKLEEGAFKCYPRNCAWGNRNGCPDNFIVDKKIGGYEYYGCRSDACAAEASPPRASPSRAYKRTPPHTRHGSWSRQASVRHWSPVLN